MDALTTNLATIKQRIAIACKQGNRLPGDVRLLLATKTVPAERIRLALLAGETLIAENQIQELKEKYDALKNTPHENHFIGHLQTNKIKDLIKYNVSCLHSLDRIGLAEQLHKNLLLANRKMEVLLQVNTSGEESKFGLHPDGVMDFVKQVAALPTLQIKGLMTIVLFSADAEKVRPCFRLLKAIQQDIISLSLPGVQMDTLSMGMSADLETAIEEGATIVRIGTALFGQRIYPDSYYWNESNSAN